MIIKTLIEENFFPSFISKKIEMVKCNQNEARSDKKSNTDLKNDDKLCKVNSRLNASYLHKIQNRKC